MPRIAIVTPAYNAAPYIAATLQSAMASTYGDLEAIVIDDGSKDDTAAVAHSVADPRIRVISRPNAGMSASRNLAAASSDSEFIAFLDADDLWHPEKLRMQLAALDARPDHAVCFSNFTWWWGEDRPGFFTEARSGQIDEQLSGWIYHRLILDNWALPSSVLIRRSAWDQLGPFLCDNQQTDDWEYLVRASHHFRFVRLEESFVLYRQVASSLSKRMPSVNHHELMRSDLIRRFGLQSPDGTPVDLQCLAEYQYRGHSNFADGHCARGDLQLGLKSFARLLTTGPQRGQSLVRLGKSLFRRGFPKRTPS